MKEFLSRHKWYSVAAVCVFVALMTWAFSAEAKNAVTLGLGAGVLDASGYVTQRIGYVENDRWYFNYERFGGRGVTDSNGFFAGRQVVLFENSDFEPFIGIGVALFTNKLEEKGEGKFLVSENLTFDLRAGLKYNLSNRTNIGVAWAHNSTAGRSKRNNGIDRVNLFYEWRF